MCSQSASLEKLTSKFPVSRFLKPKTTGSSRTEFGSNDPLISTYMYEQQTEQSWTTVPCEEHLARKNLCLPLISVCECLTTCGLQHSLYLRQDVMILDIIRVSPVLSRRSGQSRTASGAAEGFHHVLHELPFVSVQFIHSTSGSSIQMRCGLHRGSNARGLRCPWIVRAFQERGCVDLPSVGPTERAGWTSFPQKHRFPHQRPLKNENSRDQKERY